MRWWGVLAAGVAIAGALAWSLAGRSRAVQTSSVPPAPPGTFIVRVVAAGGGPLTVKAFGISRRHPQGFEQCAELVDTLERKETKASCTALIPSGEDAVQIWALTESGLLGWTAAPDPRSLRRVTITVPEPVEHAIRLLDGADRAPMAEQSVSLQSLPLPGTALGTSLYGGTFSRLASVTGTDGVVRFKVPAGLRQGFQVNARDHRKSRAFVALQPGTQIDVRIPPLSVGASRPLSGSLLLPSGAPAAGVRVTLVRDGSHQAPAWGPSQFATTTSEVGAFRLPYWPPSGEHWILAARMVRGGRWMLVGQQRVNVGADVSPMWDLRLDPPTRQQVLRLRLRLAGELLNGCEVHAHPLSGLQGDSAVASVGGTVDLYPRRDTHYLITVESRFGLEPRRRVVLKAPADDRRHDLRVPPGVTVRFTGEVSPEESETGVSAPSLNWLQVIYRPDPSRPQVKASLPVLGLGQTSRPYRLRGLPPGEYEFWGSKWGDTYLGTATLGTADARVQLRAVGHGAIEGRLVDALGRGVPGADLRASFPAGSERAEQQETGADGFFRIEAVPEGTATVTGDYPDPSSGRPTALPAPPSVTVRAGETSWVEIRLP